MKSCPTCNRTFEDTFTFCLVDGSILSAPFDPQSTGEINRRSTNPPPTEVMPPPTYPNRDALPPTLVSPQPGYTPSPVNNPALFPQQPQFFQGQYGSSNFPQKKASRLWIVSLVLFVLWLFGLTIHFRGAIIHLLLIVAIVIMVIYLINMARTNKGVR